MLKSLSIEIKTVLDRLHSANFEAYLVGGCVRDFLLGRNCDDYDITTSALPIEVKALFEHTIDTGLKHGTVTVLINHIPIEVTTFRIDERYSDSRHPESVKFTRSLKEDLKRRDFTCNAVAFNENGFCDFYGGLEDIDKKILRAVGDPTERFAEDALRIMRLYRFASVLGFSIDEATEKAATAMADGLLKISRERIFSELKKTVCGENPVAINPLISASGLSFLNIKNQISEIITKLSKNLPIRFFAFCILSGANCTKLLTELKSDNKLKTECKSLENIYYNFPESSVEIKRFLYNIPIETLILYLKNIALLKGFSSEDTVSEAKRIISSGECYKKEQLAITANDLIKLGLSGKQIGEAYEKMLEEILCYPQRNSTEELLKIICSK